MLVEMTIHKQPIGGSADTTGMSVYARVKPFVPAIAAPVWPRTVFAGIRRSSPPPSGGSRP
jgi:hypothetical protein